MNRTAVILVNWNCFDVTSDCIRSILSTQEPNLDIIVVDNGSSDNSAVRLKNDFPGITVIESATNLGFAGGNNLAMRHAINLGYEFLFLLNNDTLVKPGLVKGLIDFMDTHPEAGAVQPMIYMHHDRTLLWNGGSRYNRWLGFPYTPGYGKPPDARHHTTRQADWITGCAFFVRTSVLTRSGLFADNLFLYNEDVDLSFRIRKRGYFLYYYPEVALYHIAGASSRTAEKGKEGFVNPVVHYFSVRNRIWLLKKHTRWLQVPTVSLFHFFYILALLTYFGSRLYLSKFRNVLKGVNDGLRGGIIYQ